MRIPSKLEILVAAFFSFTAVNAQADKSEDSGAKPAVPEKSITFRHDLRLTPRYCNQRGFVPHDGLSLQQHAKLSYGMFYLDFWENIGADIDKVTEYDIDVGISESLLDGDLTLTGSWNRYAFPVQGGATQEFMLSAAFKVYYEAKINFAHDYSKMGSGNYLEVSLSKLYDDEPWKNFSMSETFAINYNDNYFIDGSGFSTAKIGYVLSHQSGNWAIKLDAAFFFAIDKTHFYDHSSAGLTISTTIR